MDSSSGDALLLVLCSRPLASSACAARAQPMLSMRTLTTLKCGMLLVYGIRELSHRVLEKRLTEGDNCVYLA